MVSDRLTALDEYKLLGRSGLRVSPLCLGTMTWGTNWGEMGTDSDESRKVFDRYLEKGGNFFDTANIYQGGSSEKALGEYISGYRSQIVTATKYSLNAAEVNAQGEHHFGKKIINPTPACISGNSRKSMVENLDASLKRMGTGYTDVFYVHIWEYRTPRMEVLRALDDVVRSGKALYIAISDTPAWVVSALQVEADIRGFSRFVGLQTRYNLLDRSFEYDLEPCCAEFGLGGIPWGILAEGFLTGKYQKGADLSGGRASSVETHVDNDQNWEIIDTVRAIAKECGRSPVQVATNWMMQKPSICAPLVGARTLKQLDENLASMEFTLTQDQMERLDKVSDRQPNKHKDKHMVPFPHNYYTYLTSYVTRSKVQFPEVAHSYVARCSGDPYRYQH